MKTALFTNFTNEEFTGYWDGKGRKFSPGKSQWMPDYLAQHFAKHLANRELLSTDSKGELVHKGGDKMTSPKFPEQVPMFMELFKKAYQADTEGDDVGEKKDDVETLIEVANKNKKEKAAAADELVTPTMDEDEEFEGKPVESN